MSAIIDEHTQWVGSDGLPLAAGMVYIGTKDGDPVATAGSTVIYSDRELTAALANPQTLDADGRATTKIFFDGQYSIQVNDSASVQQYQNLDAGAAASGTAVVTVSSILGTNTVTGVGAPTLTAYTDKQLLAIKATSANTGAVTLNIDSVGAKALVKKDSSVLVTGDIIANQSMLVIYNSSNDNFVLINPREITVRFEEAAAVAASATPNIWAGDGNTLHITGTTGITGFAAAPKAGEMRRLIFDGVVTLTHSANLNLPGAADFTTAAGDVLVVYADTTTQFDVHGSLPATTAEGTTGTQTRRFPGVSVVVGMIAERVDLTRESENTTTGGTAIDFTGLTGVDEVTIILDGLSTSDTSDIIIQIGDSGGFENTGYNATSEDSAGNDGDGGDAGFPIYVSSSADLLYGAIQLIRGTGNLWAYSSVLRRSSGITMFSGGTKTLSAALDRVRITTVGGVSTFDANGGISVSHK